MASEKVLQSLETLHRELDKLSPAIEHVQTAQKISETVKDIPNKHLELIKSIKQTDEDYKKELKEQLKSDASKITVEVNQITQKFKDTQDLLKGEIIDLEKLKKTIKDFHVDIVRINFPDRLDKMDANVAGIMAAVQAIQGRLDLVERNISDQLKNNADFQKDMRAEIKNLFEQNISFQEKNAKKQQINTYISWSILGILGILIFIFKKG
jgi:phage-related protein